MRRRRQNVERTKLGTYTLQSFWDIKYSQRGYLTTILQSLHQNVNLWPSRWSLACRDFCKGFCLEKDILLYSIDTCLFCRSNALVRVSRTHLIQKFRLIG